MYVAIVCSCPRNASDVYSTKSRFSSPMKGAYWTLTWWSTPGLKIDDLTRSFAAFVRACVGLPKAKFRMSLLPRWFDDATTFTVKPLFSRYSTAQVLNLVWPALKSVPSAYAPLRSQSSARPSHTVSWLPPLTKEQPSRAAATA